jgi:outer membrane protein
MKKLLIILFFTALPFVSNAQAKFAYFSYDAALKAMPEYATVQKNMAVLRDKYAAETKREEDEFNMKYEEFLDGQKDFAPSILQKRQIELQDLMQKSVAFKKEAERLLKQAENDAYRPLKDKLKQALQTIGKEKGYAFIINTDNDACPYIDATMGEDLNGIITNYLK